jgi:hypothetical protein
MKKINFILITALFTAGILVSGCQSSTEKVKDAREEVSQAQDELDETNAKLNQALYDSIQGYRTESEFLIAKREKELADLKLRIAKDNAANKRQYAIQVSELEKKNNAMKKRLAEFRGEGAQQWKDFKAEFSHDMNELGQSINDLNKNNVR